MLIQDLLDRAAAAERAGLWTEAAALYETVFGQETHSRHATGVVDVTRRMGHCYRQGGELEMAGEYFELSYAVARAHGDAARMGRALNGQAALAQLNGNLERAEGLYLEAQRFARTAGDELLVGETSQNLGIIANIRGDHLAALELYLAGLRSLEQAGSDHGCVSVLNNLGMLHIDLGRLEEADAYFARGLEISERTGDVVMVGNIHINRVELHLARREYGRARESCDLGFEIVSRLQDDLHRAEALKFYGVIYRETGKPHLGEIHLRESIEIAAPRDPLLEAEAQRELALVLRAQGRNRESLESLNRAHVLFTGLHAKSDNADVERKIADLEGDFLSLVRFWGETIEAKDRYTSGHCERVADYACMIAREAGLSDWELTWFRMGAFLHDVGKMEVPAEILNKPGKLSPEERGVMERHPLAGDEMLASVEFPWDVRAMVRSHHERWDGSGYPDGLAADAIPVAARILRIADIFDALTTVRSYRRSLTPEQALKLMEDDEGGFDPALFGMFQGLFPQIAEIARAAQARAEAELAAAQA
jgi:putative nucleotidyltransferase with HDIG domain